MLAPCLPTLLAPAAAVLSCVIYCINGELLQALQSHASDSEGHASPLLNLVLCHLGGLLFAPWFLWPASAAQLGAETARGRGGGLAAAPRVVALFFAVLLMCYNYAWLCSTAHIPASLTNAVFQTSVAFMYVASVVFFDEPVTWSHLIGVGLALSGSFLAASGGPQEVTAGGTGWGAFLALLASAGMTGYQVCFKMLFGHLKYDVSFLANFATWVSVWHVIVILPLVVCASWLGLEEIKLPFGFWAVVGTVVSAILASAVNALYLAIILWGSSPMLLSSISALSVPLTVALDMVLHGLHLAFSEALGHLMVVLSVVLIMQLHGSIARPLLGPGQLLKLGDMP